MIKPNARSTTIKTANGNRTLGRLVRDESGYGWNGVLVGLVNNVGVPEPRYPYTTWNDAMAQFTDFIEQFGVKLNCPSNMFNWSIIRQAGTGFFTAVPGNEEHHIGDKVVRDHISFYEAAPIVKRLNAVRSYFGPRLNEVLPDRLEEIEEMMRVK